MCRGERAEVVVGRLVAGRGEDSCREPEGEPQRTGRNRAGVADLINGDLRLIARVLVRRTAAHVDRGVVRHDRVGSEPERGAVGIRLHGAERPGDRAPVDGGHAAPGARCKARVVGTLLPLLRPDRARQRNEDNCRKDCTSVLLHLGLPFSLDQLTCKRDMEVEGHEPTSPQSLLIRSDPDGRLATPWRSCQLSVVSSQ